MTADELQWEECWDCEGHGKVIDLNRFTPGDDGTCETCEGEGAVPKEHMDT